MCESPERSCAAEEPARFEQACFPLSQLEASASQWVSEGLFGPTHALLNLSAGDKGSACLL